MLSKPFPVTPRRTGNITQPVLWFPISVFFELVHSLQRHLDGKVLPLWFHSPCPGNNHRDSKGTEIGKRFENAVFCGQALSVKFAVFQVQATGTGTAPVRGFEGCQQLLCSKPATLFVCLQALCGSVIMGRK